MRYNKVVGINLDLLIHDLGLRDYNFWIWLTKKSVLNFKSDILVR